MSALSPKAQLISIACLLFAASLSPAATIVRKGILPPIPETATNVASPIVALEGFNSSLGTLTSIELTLDLTVDVTGSFLNTNVIPVPPGIPVTAPTPVGFSGIVAPGFIETAGFPILSEAVSIQYGPLVDATPGLQTLSTEIITSKTGDVPSFLFSDFTTPAFVNLRYEASSLLLNPYSNLPIISPLVLAQGTLTAIYTYTPATPPSTVPEPLSAALLPVGLLLTLGVQRLVSYRTGRTR